MIFGLFRRVSIFSRGKTITQLIENSIESGNLHFNEQVKLVTIDQLKFGIDFKQFFQYYRVINSKFLADKMGMNSTLLSQYVQEHKKPSDFRTTKILEGIHQIGKELSEINLIYR